MKKESPAVNCPKFQRQEAAIKGITETINSSKGAGEKAKSAEELKSAAEPLLSCEDYDAKDSACGICRLVARLRRKTADLIIRAGNLA